MFKLKGYNIFIPKYVIFIATQFPSLLPDLKTYKTLTAEAFVDGIWLL